MTSNTNGRLRSFGCTQRTHTFCKAPWTPTHRFLSRLHKTHRTTEKRVGNGVFCLKPTVASYEEGSWECIVFSRSKINQIRSYSSFNRLFLLATYGLLMETFQNSAPWYTVLVNSQAKLGMCWITVSWLDHVFLHLKILPRTENKLICSLEGTLSELHDT